MKITFIGAGRWAMTLALVLHRKNIAISMWEYSEERLNILKKTKKLNDLPESVIIPDTINISNDLTDSLKLSEVIFFAIPSQELRSVLTKMWSIVDIKKSPILVSAIKGLENNSYKRISTIIKEFFPDLPVVVLAGPGIPFEIAQGKPASLVAASQEHNVADIIQNLLSDENLRVYTHPDVVGVELGGALKNVIAIAAGISDGLKLGDNAKSALITRGLSEITRLGIALNANPMTFAGLSGIGDVIVTSYSPYSRNHILGEQIGQGIILEETIKSLNGIAEGVMTAKSAKGLGSKMRVELPIIEQMYSILFEQGDIEKSIKKLMARPLKREMNYEKF